MILKQGHTYRAMPHDGKTIWRIYRGGRCYYIASPYSPEATQALKAAFPQYFATIRDYGWANPALVPFINEDPMLIVSLVETSKMREMYSDGNAYIELRLQINSITSDSTIGYRLRNASYTGSQTAMYGAKVTYNNNDLSISLGAWNNNGQAYIGYGNSYTNSWVYTKDTNPHTIRLANKIAYFDGEIKKSYSPNDFTTNPLLLYRVSGGGGDSNGLDTNTAIFFARIKDIDINIEMYPFIRNGENGMLDILSGTFYPNANTQGTFTIEITDKA